MIKQFIKRFVLFSVAALLLVGGIVVLVDPFYHYHKPIGPLKAVVSKGEYQCIGTVRNFEYDSILLGSSVAENYNNRWFDEAFGGTTIKGIQRSATTAALLYYLENALEANELKNVYFNLDTFAITTDPDEDFPNETHPLYLYNSNPFDDVKYIWNKDVIFEHVPYMLAMSFVGDYDEGTSYNWDQYKTFSEPVALSNYQRPEEIMPMLTKEEYADDIDGNLSAIEQVVKENPQITFRFICPPYSMLWWDNAYRNGETQRNLFASKEAARRLLPYENVEMYYFQNDEEVITNLDNYMDTIHFSGAINKAMLDAMKNGEYRLTLDNYEEEINKMDILQEKILREYIGLYYE